MTTPVASPGRIGGSMLGSAAWGRANSGRLTLAEQWRFAMQTVAAQLRLQWQGRGALSDDMRQRWSRLEPDRIELPDTPTVARALELLQQSVPVWLCRHSLRTWAWSTLLAQRDALKQDAEVLAVSCLLHDIALLPNGRPPASLRCACFAIDGGQRARRFLQEQGWADSRALAVEDAICLHMNPHVPLGGRYRGALAPTGCGHGCRRGAGERDRRRVETRRAEPLPTHGLRATDVRGHATASGTRSGYAHATALANGLRARNPPIRMARVKAPRPCPWTGPGPIATDPTLRKPMKYVSIVALLVAGIIHLLPVPGFMGVSTLARLYGIEVNDPNTAILLQHRALLFGVLGVLMLSAIALPWLRVTALTVALFSAASFIVVAMAVGGYNTAIGRVVVADVVASVLLAAGLVAELWLIGRKTT
jgi:hypothetical protein